MNNGHHAMHLSVSYVASEQRKKTANTAVKLTEMMDEIQTDGLTHYPPVQPLTLGYGTFSDTDKPNVQHPT